MAMDGMAGSRDHVHNCVALPMSEVDQNSAETAVEASALFAIITLMAGLDFYSHSEAH